MKIVSGRTGSPHVTSQQFRQMLEDYRAGELYYNKRRESEAGT